MEFPFIQHALIISILPSSSPSYSVLFPAPSNPFPPTFQRQMYFNFIFPPSVLAITMLQLIRDHWVHILVPMGFVFGCYLDKRNDEKLTAFRNKSMLFQRLVHAALVHLGSLPKIKMWGFFLLWWLTDKWWIDTSGLLFNHWMKLYDYLWNVNL